MNKTALAVGTAVAFLFLAAPVHAHGAPPARDFETRVLADDAEDCGGDGQTSVNGGCRGAHDLLAFNVREAYDEDLGHVVVFTLVADLGSPEGQTLTDTVTFQAKGQTKTIIFSTSDDESFTVEGAARVVGPEPARDAQGQPDGTRFNVDGWFQRSDLGLAVGDRLRDFSVTAKRGETTGDIMPGGAYNALGIEQSGNGGARDVALVELRGPIQYLHLTLQESILVEEGKTAFANLQVRNLLSDMLQTVSYSAGDGEHVRTGFHVVGSSSGSYPATMDDAIARGESEDVHLAITGLQSGTGTVTVTLATDRGGLVTGHVAYEVVPAGQSGTPPTPPDPTEGRPPNEGSPGLGWLGLFALLAFAAVRRR